MSIVTDVEGAVIPEGTWAIDPVWSSLEIQVRKAGLVDIKGRALSFTGTIRGGTSPALEGSVETASITTFDEQRDGHLRSPDFLDVERFPQITFRSDEVSTDGDELRIAGRLEIKGVSRPVELRGRFLGSSVDLMGNDRIALELTATVDRSAFGITWNAPLPGGDLLLPDEVTVVATLGAARQA